MEQFVVESPTLWQDLVDWHAYLRSFGSKVCSGLRVCEGAGAQRDSRGFCLVLGDTEILIRYGTISLATVVLIKDVLLQVIRPVRYISSFDPESPLLRTKSLWYWLVAKSLKSGGKQTAIYFYKSPVLNYFIYGDRFLNAFDSAPNIFHKPSSNTHFNTFANEELRILILIDLLKIKAILEY
jgi:hypothetical protein